MEVEAMEQAVADFLRATSLPDEEYLKDTPARVAKAWVEELLSGYAMDPAEALGGLARLAEVFARRLQTQERLTGQIARALQKALDPKGAGVAIWADHACMQAQGPRSPATTVTSKFTGVFASSQGMREEFWEHTRSRADNLIGSSTDSRVEAQRTISSFACELLAATLNCLRAIFSSEISKRLKEG